MIAGESRYIADAEECDATTDQYGLYAGKIIIYKLAK